MCNFCKPFILTDHCISGIAEMALIGIEFIGSIKLSKFVLRHSETASKIQRKDIPISTDPGGTKNKLHIDNRKWSMYKVFSPYSGVYEFQIRPSKTRLKVYLRVKRRYTKNLTLSDEKNGRGINLIFELLSFKSIAFISF